MKGSFPAQTRFASMSSNIEGEHNAMTEPHEWYPGLFVAFAVHFNFFLRLFLSFHLLVVHLLAEGMRKICFLYVVVWRQRQEYLASGVSIISK